MYDKAVKRSENIVGNTEFERFADVALRCFGGDHYYRSVIYPVVAFHNIKHTESVNSWHYYIKQNEIYIIYPLFEDAERFFSVSRLDNIIIIAQHIAQHITVHLRVINNKYTGVLFRRIIHIIPPLQIIVIVFYYHYI